LIQRQAVSPGVSELSVRNKPLVQGVPRPELRVGIPAELGHIPRLKDFRASGDRIESTGDKNIVTVNSNASDSGRGGVNGVNLNGVNPYLGSFFFTYPPFHNPIRS
jgi:hypothetical protein